MSSNSGGDDLLNNKDFFNTVFRAGTPKPTAE